MRLILLIKVLFLLFVTSSHAQSLAYQDASLLSSSVHARLYTLQTGSIAATFNPGTYSQANFVRYGYRKHNREWLTGGITAISGGIFAWSGLLMYALGSDQTTGPPNRGMQDAGIGLMIAGGAAAIIGGVIAHKGKMEDRHMYGWQIVSPKINEIGVAYSLK